MPSVAGVRRLGGESDIELVGPGEPSRSPSCGGLGSTMRNFKNAGGYYLTRTGVKMLVVAFPQLLRNPGQRCDQGMSC